MVENDPGILINKYDLIAINKTQHRERELRMAMNS